MSRQLIGLRLAKKFTTTTDLGSSPRVSIVTTRVDIRIRLRTGPTRPITGVNFLDTTLLADSGIDQMGQ
jgi:hypothetical protein